MPQVPVKTAEGGGGYPRFTTNVDGGDRPGEAALVRSVQSLGHAVNDYARISRVLADQRDDLLFSNAKTLRTAGIEQIHQEFAKNPQLRLYPDQYEQEFATAVRDLDTKITEQYAASPRVQQFYGNYAQTAFQVDVVKARATSHKLATVEAKGMLEQDRALAASQAATLDFTVDPDPIINPKQLTNYERTISDFHEKVNRAYDRGFLTLPEKVKELETFTKERLTKEMAFLSEEDPQTLISATLEGAYDQLDRDDRAKFMEKAQKNILERDTANQNAMKGVKTTVKEWWAVRAFNNDLPDQDINDAKSGKNPWITAEEAEHFRKLRDNPQGGNKEVNSIMDGLNSITTPGGPTQADYAKTLNRLNLIESRSDDLTRAKLQVLQRAASAVREERALSAAERQAESAFRAESNQRYTNMQRDISAAHAYYDSQKRALGIQMPGFKDNKEVIDKAMIGNIIRKSWNENKEVNPTEVVDVLIETKKVSHTNRSQIQKDIEEILAARRGAR